MTPDKSADALSVTIAPLETKNFVGGINTAIANVEGARISDASLKERAAADLRTARDNFIEASEQIGSGEFDPIRFFGVLRGIFVRLHNVENSLTEEMDIGTYIKSFARRIAYYTVPKELMSIIRDPGAYGGKYSQAYADFFDRFLKRAYGVTMEEVIECIGRTPADRYEWILNDAATHYNSLRTILSKEVSLPGILADFIKGKLGIEAHGHDHSEIEEMELTKWVLLVHHFAILAAEGAEDEPAGMTPEADGSELKTPGELAEIVAGSLITVVETLPAYREAPRETKIGYGIVDRRRRLVEDLREKITLEQRAVEDALRSTSLEGRGLHRLTQEIPRCAKVREVAARLFAALPLPVDGQVIAHYIPKELYDLNTTLWQELEKYLNDRAGRRAYKITPVALKSLSLGTPRNTAEGLSILIGNLTRETAVLYLPKLTIMTLGPALLAKLQEKATLVSYGGSLNERAVYAEGLLAYGEGLRNIRSNEDTFKYGIELANIYNVMTREGVVFDLARLRTYMVNPTPANLYDFLKNVVVEFPDVTPGLQDWLLRHEKDRLSEAITELAV